MMKKVLLIEDDKIVRENTSEILELANYEVITAENGKIGVQLAKSFKPDIVVCDILMPVLDGYGVLQILSKTKDLNQIPFIFLTAKTHQEELRKGMEFGADDYISKPFEESVLLRAIESRLKRVEVFEKKISQGNDNIINDENLNVKGKSEYLDNKRIFKFEKGETIFCEGNQSNHIFLIKKGLIKTYKMNEQGKELITAFYTDNDFFGYSSFVKHAPHSENSKAITTAYIYKLDKEEIGNLVANNKNFLFKVINRFSEDLISSKERLLVQAYGSVRKKTAFTLLELLNNYPVKQSNQIVITRLNLANTIGIAKETLTRTLHDFKDEKLIEVSTKGVTILNKRKLQQIS